MHLKDLQITGTFSLTGRGKTFITNLDFDEHEWKFMVGDTFRYGDKIYEIKNVAAILKSISNTEKKDMVAFVVREISTKELLKKIAASNRRKKLNVLWRKIRVEFYTLKIKLKKWF